MTEEQKWKRFDEAVALLAAYIRRGADGWDIAIYVDESGDSNDITPAMAATLQAHRVLDLLVKLNVEAVYNWRREQMSLSGTGPEYALTGTIYVTYGKVPQATLACATSDELQKWRQANAKSLS